VRRGALLALALLCGAGSAQALTPTAQDRHVFGENEVQPPFPGFVWNETFSAPDYGPFVSQTDGFPPTTPPFSPPFTGPPVATQDSRIDSDALHAELNSVVAAAGGVGVGQRVKSESVYSVSFSVDAGAPYTLTGQIGITSAPCGTSSAHIRLTGPGGVLAQRTTAGILDVPLVLAPGSYTLESRTDAEATGGTGPHGSCAGSATADVAVDLAPDLPVVPALPVAAAPVLTVALALTARRRGWRRFDS
jgi:hypothetical protein